MQSTLLNQWLKTLGHTLLLISFHQFTYTFNGEKDINLHLPYSIIVLLGLCFAINMSFRVYSIKKLRCCELSIDWEKTAKISKSGSSCTRQANEALHASSAKESLVLFNKAYSPPQKVSTKNLVDFQASKMGLQNQQNDKIPNEISHLQKLAELSEKAGVEDNQILSNKVQQAPLQSRLYRKSIEKQIKRHLKQSVIATTVEKKHYLSKKCSNWAKPLNGAKDPYPSDKYMHEFQSLYMTKGFVEDFSYKYTKRDKYSRFQEYDKI